MNGGPFLGATPGVAAAAAAAAIVLLTLVLRWEMRRRPRSRARLATSAASVAALVLLVLRPGCAAPSPAAEAWLVTPGASTDRPAGAPPAVFQVGSGPHRGRAASIPDAAWLGRNHPEIETLGVLGHGLEPWDWDAIPSPARWVERAALTPGFRQVTWPRRISLGDELIVQGRVEGRGATDLAVHLAGPGGSEGSRELADGAEGTFELRALPRDTGRFLYRLSATGLDAPIEEILDVVVAPPREIAVLWLESGPRFETRHLKSWLAKRTDPLVVRSVISRGRFRREFHNHPETDISRLTPELLGSFDLVVLDGATWRELAGLEREAIRSAVEETGLGVLLLPHGPGLPAGSGSPWAAFATRRVGDLDEMAVTPAWPGGKRPTALTIPALELLPRPATSPLVRDDAGRILAATRPAGRGTIAVSLLEKTYRWILEGNAAAHHHLWSHLLEATARGDDAPRWHVPPAPVLVDQPLSLVLETPAPRPAARAIPEGGDPLRLTLRQDPLEPRRWRTTFWPPHPGWYRVETGDGEGSWFHAQARDRWVTAQQARRLDATDAHAALGAAARKPTQAAGLPTFRPFPRIVFLLLFLASAFTLWIQERW